MKEYGEFGEKAGKHVLDCAGNPIYAGSYVHMTYTNKVKRVAQVFAEGEAFELKSGAVIDERNSGKSEKILFKKSKSCRQEMILDIIDRAKRLAGVEEQEGER